MQVPVDLLLPIKPLASAKTRLRAGVDRGDDLAAHFRLVLALAQDTAAAAVSAAMVRRTVVICSDALVCRIVAVAGVEALADEPGTGLNSALQYGEALLRAADPTTAVAAIPADLPALCAGELDCAIRDALATGGRAFCVDAVGTGTTLLLAPPGCALDPRFGPGSAAAHRASGAHELIGHWPGLRCDVDTSVDLVRAGELGVGRCTEAALHRRQSGISFPGEPTVYPCD
jgi:2-phospho-L-lactate/phosphoenolpyruvate guanylyltransferase